MILTGKARADFERWLFYNRFGQRHDTFSFVQHKLDSKLLIALYVEWLDTVGLHLSVLVDIRFSDGKPEFVGQIDYLLGRFVNAWSSDELETRHEATEAAIRQASEIYNSRA